MIIDIFSRKVYNNNNISFCDDREQRSAFLTESRWLVENGRRGFGEITLELTVDGKSFDRQVERYVILR